MEVKRSERGFEFLIHPHYRGCEPNASDRLASQSSAIGDYEDALIRPGSSFLWIGDNHHLSREEVAEFVVYLQRWYDTGHLGQK